jgi:hypothetical protein
MINEEKIEARLAFAQSFTEVLTISNHKTQAQALLKNKVSSDTCSFSYNNSNQKHL